MVRRANVRKMEITTCRKGACKESDCVRAASVALSPRGQVSIARKLLQKSRRHSMTWQVKHKLGDPKKAADPRWNRLISFEGVFPTCYVSALQSYANPPLKRTRKPDRVNRNRGCEKDV